MDCIGKKRTVDIPRGEFTKIRGPSDLAEVQGRYNVIFSKRFKAQEGIIAMDSREGHMSEDLKKSGFRVSEVLRTKYSGSLKSRYAISRRSKDSVGHS
jgi:hypothetical protein